MAFIAEVKRYGARIAMDDFGSGYSNFESLIQLDVDFLKIDGSLIKNIIVDRNSEIVLETLISFAGKLGITTIAEFVSSEELYNKIKSMGVDFAQGYFIGRPEPLIEMDASSNPSRRASPTRIDARVAVPDRREDS
ncbi:hypothetical protein CKO27_05240 [Thiocystis violacea]|nr:hypothetical protein [Thiocystis violacea]